MTSNRPFILSIVAVLFAVATVLVSTEAFARTWKTDKSSIEGEFDSLQDNGTKVRIKRSDGKFVRVDLNKLSEEDRLYIEQNYTNSDFEEEPEESDFEEEKEPASSIIPSVPKEDNSVENLIKTVKLLENEGQHLVARQKLLKALQDEFSEKLVDLWIQLDANLCPSSQNYKHSKSVFTPEEQTNEEIALSTGSWVLDGTTLGGGYFARERAKKLKKERLDKDVAKDFGTLDKDSISKTLEIYDTLKKSTETLLSYLNNEILNTEDNKLLKKISDYSVKVKAFKNKIKIQRTNYLSYCVVSPYLADVDRWLYLSNEQKEWFLWPQKEALDKAIKVLSFSCHGQHLYECNEDIRKQFFDVQKKLKSMVSSTVYEELKVLTTLIDSSDPSKKRGADAWWE